jgi:hypothetical protein
MEYHNGQRTKNSDNSVARTSTDNSVLGNKNQMTLKEETDKVNKEMKARLTHS